LLSGTSRIFAPNRLFVQNEKGQLRFLGLRKQEFQETEYIAARSPIYTGGCQHVLVWGSRAVGRTVQ